MSELNKFPNLNARRAEENETFLNGTSLNSRGRGLLDSSTLALQVNNENKKTLPLSEDLISSLTEKLTLNGNENVKTKKKESSKTKPLSSSSIVKKPKLHNQKIGVKIMTRTKKIQVNIKEPKEKPKRKSKSKSNENKETTLASNVPEITFSLEKQKFSSEETENPIEVNGTAVIDTVANINTDITELNYSEPALGNNSSVTDTENHEGNEEISTQEVGNDNSALGEDINVNSKIVSDVSTQIVNDNQKDESSRKNLILNIYGPPTVIEGSQTENKVLNIVIPCNGNELKFVNISFNKAENVVVESKNQLSSVENSVPSTSKEAKSEIPKKSGTKNKSKSTNKNSLKKYGKVKSKRIKKPVVKKLSSKQVELEINSNKCLVRNGNSRPSGSESDGSSDSLTSSSRSCNCHCNLCYHNSSGSTCASDSSLSTDWSDYTPPRPKNKLSTAKIESRRNC